MQKLSQRRAFQRIVHLRRQALYRHGEYGRRRPPAISSTKELQAIICEYGSLNCILNRAGSQIPSRALNNSLRHQTREYNAYEPKGKLQGKTGRFWSRRKLKR